LSFNSIHVVPSISNESSGPSYSVVRLCQSLIESGISTNLVNLEDSIETNKAGFVKSFPFAGFPKRLGRSPDMRRWLVDAARSGRLDIMHNHSLWMMPNVYACNAIKGTNVPLIVSPRGTLSKRALKTGSKVKRIFWPLIQRPALQAVSCFHATAESEFEDIRRMGFQQPVAIIPNGVDLPEPAKTHRGPERTLLFLGRIHPIKGLDLLLPAWGAVQDRFPEWRLRIVGPDNLGYLGQMKKLGAQLGLKRVGFTGPLVGSDKAQAYAEADLFVLPTYSENFGMTVAEALAAGTPAIVTRGAPWSGLDERNAGRWIDIGVDPLTTCLEELLHLSRSDMDDMGLNGRNWMAEDYSWTDIARRMIDTYNWVIGGYPRPECVRC